jgi:hypothetical protein
MRKSLLLPAIAFMVLFSCKKEHTASTNPSAKKYKVTFNVSNFTAVQNSFAVRHAGSNLASDTITNLSGYLDVLYYEVYDNNGIAVQAPMMQDSTMSNMGMITDSLPAGNYAIAVAAGKKGLALTGYNDGSQEYYFSYGGGPNWRDTFWGIAGFTVSSDPVSQSITLYRQVGEIELNILDNMPATADSLFMTLSPEANGIALNGDQGFTLGPSLLQGTASLAVAIPASAKGKPNYTADLLVGPTLPGTQVLTIVCKDAANRVLGSVTIGGTQTSNYALNVQPNVKTVVSGDLFTGTTANSSQTFIVKADTAWNSTPNQVSFSLRRH